MSQELVEVEQASRDELAEALRKQRVEIEILNKEFEAFAHSVAHDLRAPLRAIEGFSQVLIEDYADKFDEEGRRLLDIIGKSSHKAATMIDCLRRLSKIGLQPMKPSIIRTGEMVNGVRVDIGPIAEGVQWRVSNLPDAWGDATLVAKIWAELIHNAVKFSAKSRPPVVEIGGRREPGHSVFYVRDNGIGFEQRHAEQIFGVFSRLHGEDEYPGPGVGLTIVQRIVRRHEGEVWAEGKPGEGATFFFSLPIPENGR